MGQNNDKMSQPGAVVRDMLSQNIINFDETIVFIIKPSLWSLFFFSFRTISFCLTMIFLVYNFSHNLDLQQYREITIKFLLAAIWARLIIAFLQWMMRSYILTDQRIITVSGVLTVRVFECNHRKIQNTIVEMSLIQRILGLGTIGFATAGTGYIESLWQHIKNPKLIHQQIIKYQKKS